MAYVMYIKKKQGRKFDRFGGQCFKKKKFIKAAKLLYEAALIKTLFSLKTWTHQISVPELYLVGPRAIRRGIVLKGTRPPQHATTAPCETILLHEDAYAGAYRS